MHGVKSGVTTSHALVQEMQAYALPDIRRPQVFSASCTAAVRPNPSFNGTPNGARQFERWG